MSVLPMGRSVKFHPGYDKRNEPGPNGEQYGIHGMDITFFYRGESGAVQFKFLTGWVPWQPAPAAEPLWGPRYKNLNPPTINEINPAAADLGYHSPEARYEGHEPMTENCPFIGGPCYYDGSGLNAEPLLVALIYEGEEAVWKALEAYYAETFILPVVTP